MMQRIKAILDDDRGVSPVIGVILMVAITVILAAVIGTFVLGLGDSLEQAPQAQLNADSENSNNVTISHDGGDALTVSDVRVNIPGVGDDVRLDNSSSDFSGSEFGVGDSAEFSGADDGEIEVRIIHEPSESILLDTTVDVED